MFIFNCMNCSMQTQAEYEDIGELVECPECGFVQIIPEPVIAPGGYFEEYLIKKLLASGLVWNTYHAQIWRRRVLIDCVLKIPTGFLLKRVSDFNALADIVKAMGSSEIREFPVLTDSSVSEGRNYFAYDYINNLRTVTSFAIDAPVKASDALKVCRKVAIALSSAWKQYKIAHLNLNPGTVSLVISTLEVKIGGYGVSSFLATEDRLLKDGLNIWDFRYVCPEFIRQGKSDSQAFDIYSLGRILYFMLSGAHPPEPDEMGNQMGPALTVSLTAVNPGLPMPLMSLINSMTDPDPRHRIASWDEVIGKMDSILSGTGEDGQMVEYRRKFNIWKKYTPSSARTGDRVVSGLRAGALGGNASQKVHDKKSGHKKVAVRVLARNSINPVNRNWRMYDRQDTSDISAWKAAAAILVSICIAASIFIAKEIMLPENEPAASDRPLHQAVPENPLKNQSAVPEGKDTVKKELPQVQGGQQVQSSLQDKIIEIDNLLKANPEGFDMVIRKYEELKRPYVLSNNAKVVGDINERIFDIEKKRQVKVDETVSEILKTILPLLEKNEKDKAVIYLDSYSGGYASETKRQRKEIARKILDGMSIVDINRGEAVKFLDSVLEKNIKSIAAGNFDRVLADLKELLQKPRDEMVGQMISSFIVDIEDFVSIRSDFQKKLITEKAIRLKLGSKPEGDAFLLKALAYAEIGDYAKSFENFERLPYGTGNIFIMVFSESEAAASLRKILANYGITYDPAQPDKLSEVLYKKQIDSAQAQKLLDEIKSFESEFSDSQLLADNASLLEILRKYAFNHLNDDQKKKQKEITISAGGAGRNAASSGQELLLLLEKADNFTTIYLKKGIYRFSREDGRTNKDNETERRSKLEQSSAGTASFKVSLTGLKLIGEEGVVFEDDITVTAQSVQISNIRINRGKLSILPNNLSVLPDSGNILVKNCFFNDIETRVQQGVDIVFDNCFSRGMFIQKSRNVILNHCTIISQERGLSQNAALWIDGGSLKVSNCIIYGNALAIMFSDKGNRVTKESDIKTEKTIEISDTVFFGEQGFCSFQFENRTLADDDIVKNPARISRYCSPKRNIYYPPQFINYQDGNWRLAKGTPGYKGGSPKYKGGPLYFRNLKYGQDCGVIWPDSENK